MPVATSCASVTFTINSAAEATALAACSTLDGDVVIGPEIGQIEISGPTQINGNLIVEDIWDVTSLSSPDLTTITGVLELTNVTLLSTINMPALTSVGSIHFESLPALTNLSFASGITAVESITMEDTFLASMEDFMPTSIDQLTLLDNRRLNKVDLPVRTITGTLTARGNGASAEIHLPNLVFAQVLKISNATSFDARRLEAIEKVALFENNHFTSLDLPSWQKCGDLVISNSPNLTEAVLPALKVISGQLNITNNTKLAVVDGFKDLATVGADMNVRGLFSE